jgi:hypothetical protein
MSNVQEDVAGHAGHSILNPVMGLGAINRRRLAGFGKPPSRRLRNRELPFASIRISQIQQRSRAVLLPTSGRCTTIGPVLETTKGSHGTNIASASAVGFVLEAGRKVGRGVALHPLHGRSGRWRSRSSEQRYVGLALATWDGGATVLCREKEGADRWRC